MINLINLVAVEYRMVVQFPTVSCFSFFHVCVFFPAHIGLGL